MSGFAALEVLVGHLRISHSLHPGPQVSKHEGARRFAETFL